MGRIVVLLGCFSCFLMFSARFATAAENSGLFNVLDSGAKGDGKSDDTAAIQKAIDAAQAQGGGQVLLPAGKTFLTGVLTLRSNVDFHLQAGAVLKGSANWRDYGNEGALLFAKDATNLSISGDGIIDGNDQAVWQKLADEQAGGNINRPGWWPNSFVGDYWPFGMPTAMTRRNGGRPMMMILIGCKQLRLRDINLRNAPSWTVHLIGCQDTLIQGITIHNGWDVPNNDGIDLDHCQDARIANCSIDAADDCIVIKNTPNFASYGACARITVTGCTTKSRSAALKIDEIYTQPGARDIVFSDCVVSSSNRGLCIQSRDAGDIQNVIFSNIVIDTQFYPGRWWGSAEPIHVSHFPRTAQTQLGHVRNIRFNNILCRGENGVMLQGWPSQPLEDIAMDNVRIEMAKTTDAKGFYDLRPEGIFKGVFVTRLAGIYARNINGLFLRDTKVVWGQGIDDTYGKGLDQENLQDFETDHASLNDAPIPTTQKNK